MTADFDDSGSKGRKGGGGRGKKPLSPADTDLWQRYAADIEKLPPSGPPPVVVDAPPAPDVPRPQKRRAPAQAAPVIPPPVSSPAPAQLDRRTAEKLRKGQMEIEAQIDLHGHTQARARDVLEEFIIRAHQRGLRCVLVITGKGKSYEDDAREWVFNDGVLRGRVPEWLAASALAPLVLKHMQAQPRHGGAGAYYVYLRRTRSG